MFCTASGMATDSMSQSCLPSLLDKLASMTNLACRHRGEAISPDVSRCHSPKLIGLKLVTESMCGTCHYRDHDPGPPVPAVPPLPNSPVHLLPCLRLGRETSDTLA